MSPLGSVSLEKPEVGVEAPEHHLNIIVKGGLDLAYCFPGMTKTIKIECLGWRQCMECFSTSFNIPCLCLSFCLCEDSLLGECCSHHTLLWSFPTALERMCSDNSSLWRWEVRKPGGTFWPKPKMKYLDLFIIYHVINTVHTLSHLIHITTMPVIIFLPL